MSDSTFATEDSPLVARLRGRMDEFYSTTTTYPAFQHVVEKPDEWTHVVAAIRERLEKAEHCRALEIGAGKSGFGTFLGHLRDRVRWTAQDVTSSNEDHLRSQADEVLVGPLAAIKGPFDVIFSTFVLEHVSDPRASLEHLFDLLEPGGVLFVFCPRYDFPFYLSHSADHYSPVRRVALGCELLARRLFTWLTGKAGFLIHLDPAVFHLPFVIDRDAIHWVSLFDLEALFRRRATLRRLPIEARGSWKQWIVKRFLTVNVSITKPAATS